MINCVEIIMLIMKLNKNMYFFSKLVYELVQSVPLDHGLGLLTEIVGQYQPQLD